MDLLVLEKKESSILNDLGYIVRLEKKNGNSTRRSLILDFTGYSKGMSSSQL